MIMNYSFLKEAKTLIATNRTDEAIELLYSCITEYPEYQTAYHLLINVLIGQKRIDEAEEVLRQALQRFPRQKFFQECHHHIQEKIKATLLDQSAQTLLSEHQDTGRRAENQLILISDTAPIARDEKNTNKSSLGPLEQFWYSNKRPPRQYNPAYIRLIPGLEYTSIEHDDILHPTLHTTIRYFPDLPEWIIESPYQIEVDTAAITDQEVREVLSPLEKIAKELEKLRQQPNINEQVPQEKVRKEPQQESHLPPHMISESMALILEKQGHLQQALQIYEKLRQIKPERTTYYEKKITELQKALSS